MNELYVRGMWFYYKTKATKEEDAFAEFVKACESVGIEVCGVNCGELRYEADNNN